MIKCFFTDCNKSTNLRGKFCEEHDKLEREAASELASIFERIDNKKGAA
ncbi:MAG: hypothetical protein Q9M19_07670 [Mariprofundaceae bacterium]|nr:hypothetical protein [Mariprofundaceae bacterium]